MNTGTCCGLFRFSFPEFCSGVSFLAILISPGFAIQPPASPSPTKPVPAAMGANLEKLSVEELIDRLQDLTSDDEARPTLSWGIDYPHPNDPPAFRAMGSRSFHPKTPPIVRELLRRGVESLPKLLDHLEDKRLTKMVLVCFGFGTGSEYFTNEYDSKFKNPALQPSGTVPLSNLTWNPQTRDGFEKIGRWDYRYTVKVGDLCYFLVGEIVHRNLQAVDYRDNGGTRRIGSPSRVPALARACREEWSGLTAEQHKASLVYDGFRFSFNPAAPIEALTRLYFYYPEEGEKRIVNHIQRATYDRSLVGDFVFNNFLDLKNCEYERLDAIYQKIICINKINTKIFAYLCNNHFLNWKYGDILFYINDRLKDLADELLFIKVVSIPSDEVSRELLNDFRKKNGSEITNQIPILMAYYYIDSEINDNLFYTVPKFKAKIMLNKLFPEFDRNKYRFINSVNKEDLKDFIGGLPEFSNKKIDQAIFEVFQQASTAAPNQHDDHKLAMTCLSRLAGKQFDAQLKPYLVKRIEEVKKIPDPRLREFSLKTHLDLLKQLKE